MAEIALVHTSGGRAAMLVRASQLRDLVDCHDVDDLPGLDLERYRGLIVAGDCDQDLLLESADRVWHFLAEGKALAFGGRLSRPWLPGAGMFQPKVIRARHDARVWLVQDHPIFAGVRERDLTVRAEADGDVGLGHHAPPPGAEVLARLCDPEDGEPMVYVDRVSTAGVMLVQAGADLLASLDHRATADRIAPQLVHWMLAEAAARERVTVARAPRVVARVAVPA